MGTIVTIISIFVLCALFGGAIVDFFCKIIGLFLLGGVFGLVGGAFGWLIATVICSAGMIGFFAGFIVGIIIYICKWF